MTEEDDLRQWLQSALPPVGDERPSRDLWPLIVARGRARTEWSWFDISIAAIVATVLLLFPDWLWVLAFHL